MLKFTVLVLIFAFSLVLGSKPAAAYESYYFISDPQSPNDGQVLSNNKIPVSYDMFASNTGLLFYTYAICPSVETDFGDYEILPNCTVFDLNSFNRGSYHSEIKDGGQVQLLYPGVNNVGCVIFSTKDNGYQFCDDYDRIRVSYNGDKFPVYRFWSNTKQHHFYTIEHTEKRQVVDNYDDNTWKYEQIAWTAKKFNGSACASGSPVYRFWSDQKQGHFYTINPDEKNHIQSNYPANVWRYEGVAYCAPMFTNSCPDPTYSPVYRFWSDQKQGHFYTISSSEKNHIQSTYPQNVWRYEGVAFCAEP